MHFFTDSGVVVWCTIVNTALYVLVRSVGNSLLKILMDQIVPLNAGALASGKKRKKGKMTAS